MPESHGPMEAEEERMDTRAELDAAEKALAEASEFARAAMRERDAFDSRLQLAEKDARDLRAVLRLVQPILDRVVVGPHDKAGRYVRKAVASALREKTNE